MEEEAGDETEETFVTERNCSSYNGGGKEVGDSCEPGARSMARDMAPRMERKTAWSCQDKRVLLDMEVMFPFFILKPHSMIFVRHNFAAVLCEIQNKTPVPLVRMNRQ